MLAPKVIIIILLISLELIIYSRKKIHIFVRTIEFSGFWNFYILSNDKPLMRYSFAVVQKANTNYELILLEKIDIFFSIKYYLGNIHWGCWFWNPSNLAEKYPLNLRGLKPAEGVWMTELITWLLGLKIILILIVRVHSISLLRLEKCCDSIFKNHIYLPCWVQE